MISLNFATMKFINTTLIVILLYGCRFNKIAVNNHSYSTPSLVKIQHLNLKLKIDFASKKLAGFAEYDIAPEKIAENLILDIKHLIILAVEVDNVKTSFSFGPQDDILGQALIIPITNRNKKVKIIYETTEKSAALQWADPQQTYDKKHPFLYTQSQAILARTWIPIADCPAYKFTYSATIQCPKNLMAVMSADNPQKKNDSGIYHFHQKKPISSYLLALACGDIAFKGLGRNCGVYAETDYLDKCANELTDLQNMIDSAEALYGKYAWGRYDVLVLPPSFPFGGMENPNLTFATPTIIAGDKSLVSLIAHELAHSWSGNLVTNATWQDFWLNEGFTVYFEQRIMEKIYGKDYAEMLATLARGELQKTVDDLLKKKPNDTKLYLNLQGRDPDDGLTDIAYEKGRFFLRHIENTIGRKNWDAFLKLYFNEHEFSTINTQQFLKDLQSRIIKNNAELDKKIDAKTWIFGKGLPESCEKLEHSKEIEKVKLWMAEIEKKGFELAKRPSDFTTHHWNYFLRNFPKWNLKNLELANASLQIGSSTNSEILFDWFMLCIEHKYTSQYSQIEKFLSTVGRRKFILPIYEKLAEKEKTLAITWFNKYKNNYHSVATQSLEEALYANK